MANWKYHLNICDIWQNDEMPVAEKGRKIAQRIKRVFPNEWFDFESNNYNDEINDIVEHFENIAGYDDVSPIEEFNDVMDMLYDFGDLEVEPFGQWPPNKMAWIKTR